MNMIHYITPTGYVVSFLGILLMLVILSIFVAIPGSIVYYLITLLI